MESIDSTIVLTSLFTVILLILGFWFLKEKGKGGIWYLLLIIFFTPIFWIVVGLLKSKNPTKKTKIISIVSVLLGTLFFYLSIIGFPQNSISSSDTIEIYDYELGMSFREYLINNDIDIDINVPNKFESLQQDNKYSNYYFNFSTVFPDNFEIDRGMSEYSIIRGSNKDYAISVSLNVVPKNPELSDDRIMTNHNSFQESPTTTLNNSVDGNYSDVLKTQFEKNSGFPIKNLITEEKKIRTMNYFYYIFNYEEEVEGMVIEFIMEGFQTILWGNTFTFIYSTPKMFYDNSLLEYVLFETNYIRPKS